MSNKSKSRSKSSSRKHKNTRTTSKRGNHGTAGVATYGPGRWTENQLAEWLIEQIKEYDAGLMPPEHVAQLTDASPEWLSDETRFHYGLFMDWTQERLATFLGAKLAAYDAGTMSAQDKARMDRTMPDWLTDAARIFCGLTPAGW